MTCPEVPSGTLVFRELAWLCDASEEARGAMKNRRIRHLPVLDGDEQLLGLVSIGDLNAYLAHDQEVTIHILHEYIQGRV